MNHRILEDLYHATEEDLLYGIGLLALPNKEPAPCIHIHYRGWSREKLEIVRESFRAGLILTSMTRADGASDVRISTRERIGIQTQQDGHTSMLQAPAWDARLAEINERVTRQFEAGSRRYGGFLLLMQTPKWEFLAAVSEACGETTLGPILPRSLPVPSGQA